MNWKCLEEDCLDDSMYYWKGLCKSCTDYDKDGKVIKSIQRQQVTSTGTKIVKRKLAPNPQPITLQDMINVRRQQKKLTKKQMAALRAADAHTKRDHMHNDAEIMEIGESIEEE